MPYMPMPSGGWPSGDTTLGRIAQWVLIVALAFMAWVVWRKIRDIFRD